MAIRKFFKRLIQPDEKQSIDKIKNNIKKQESVSEVIKQKKQDIEFERYIAELERKIKTDTSALKIQSPDYIPSLQISPEKEKEFPPKANSIEKSPSSLLLQEEKPATKTKEEPLTEQAYPSGTILKLDNGTLGIYKQPIPNKEYDLIYILNKKGKIEPRGMVIFAYECQVLGRLSEEVLNEMQKTMRWTRDEIIFHLDKFEYTKFIPSKFENEHNNNNSQKKTAIIDINKIEPKQTYALQRGRKIAITVGDKVWESIYWGEDDIGTIVAHHTSGEWNLMHIDLKRFGDSVHYKEVIDLEEIKKIEDVIKKSVT